MKNKTLQSFINYCDKYPTERFWQALRNWSEADFILYQKGTMEVDTFNWEKRDGFDREIEEQ